MVVYSYEATDKGEDFAEGNEDGRVNNADGREREGGGEQCASEDAHCRRRKQLENGLFHLSLFVSC